MAENFVDNRKIRHKPVNENKIDTGESTIFSKKIDKNLWEVASKELNSSKENKQNIKHQIFKVSEETQQYLDLFSRTSEKKIDYNC